MLIAQVPPIPWLTVRTQPAGTPRSSVEHPILSRYPRSLLLMPQNFFDFSPFYKPCP